MIKGVVGSVTRFPTVEGSSYSLVIILIFIKAKGRALVSTDISSS